MSENVAARLANVNLSDTSNLALINTMELLGETSTEVINRALQMYNQVMSTQNNGGTYYYSFPDSDDIHKVRWH